MYEQSKYLKKCIFLAKDPAAEGILMEMASNAPIEGDVNVSSGNKLIEFFPTKSSHLY